MQKKVRPRRWWRRRKSEDTRILRQLSERKAEVRKEFFAKAKRILEREGG